MICNNIKHKKKTKMFEYIFSFVVVFFSFTYFGGIGSVLVVEKL